MVSRVSHPAVTIDGYAHLLSAQVVNDLRALAKEVTERIVIQPPPRFFPVTKRIHNLLQGADGKLSREELEFYFQTIQEIADGIRQRSLEADVWFFHDPNCCRWPI